MFGTVLSGWRRIKLEEFGESMYNMLTQDPALVVGSLGVYLQGPSGLSKHFCDTSEFTRSEFQPLLQYFWESPPQEMAVTLWKALYITEVDSISHCVGPCSGQALSERQGADSSPALRSVRSSGLELARGEGLQKDREGYDVPGFASQSIRHLGLVPGCLVDGASESIFL